MKDVVNKLINSKKTIATMESCTGGFIASSITDVDGSSEVFKFGAITYSNEYKIKMGVSSDTIDNYSVYSIEVAREMAKCISDYVKSDYGIGVTGKINREDINNLGGSNSKIFCVIYSRNDNRYYELFIDAIDDSRVNNKCYIMKCVRDALLEVI